MTQIPMHTLGTLRVPLSLFTDNMLMGGGRERWGEGKAVGGKGGEKERGRRGRRKGASASPVFLACTTV